MYLVPTFLRCMLRQGFSDERHFYELPSLESWTKGHTILIGDAAHALPRDKGQGLSQAIEDVFIISRVLESDKPLVRYEKIRQPRILTLRREIKRNRREREVGPWRAWLREWMFGMFLCVLNLLGDWWPNSTFAYDPGNLVSMWSGFRIKRVVRRGPK
jgi:2-polyprenyl-6-methoxyphenol hydroxylase-like FAD-dependent oxidoreductase